MRPASAAPSSSTVGGGSGSSGGDCEFVAAAGNQSASNGSGGGHDAGAMNMSEFDLSMDISGGMNMDIGIGMNLNEWGDVGVPSEVGIDVDMMFESSSRDSAR